MDPYLDQNHQKKNSVALTVAKLPFSCPAPCVADAMAPATLTDKTSSQRDERDGIAEQLRCVARMPNLVRQSHALAKEDTTRHR